MTRTLRPFAIAPAATAPRQPTLRPMAAALDPTHERPLALTRLRAVSSRTPSPRTSPGTDPASTVPPSTVPPSTVVVTYDEMVETPLERAVRAACEVLAITAAGVPG